MGASVSLRLSSSTQNGIEPVKRLPLRYPENLEEQRKIVEAVAAVSRYVELTSARSPSIRALIKQDTLNPQDSTDGNLDSEDVADESSNSSAMPAELEWLLHYVFVCLKSWFQVNGFSLLIRTACRRL